MKNKLKLKEILLREIKRQINELSPELLNRAADKASTPNRQAQSDAFVDYNYKDYVGRQVLDGKITKLGDKNDTLSIKIEGGGVRGIVYYLKSSDNVEYYDFTTGKQIFNVQEEIPMNKKSASTLYQIIKRYNPSTNITPNSFKVREKMFSKWAED